MGKINSKTQNMVFIDIYVIVLTGMSLTVFIHSLINLQENIFPSILLILLYKIPNYKLRLFYSGQNGQL